MLKDPALHLLGPEPKPRHDLGPEVRESVVATSLAEAVDNAVKVAILAREQGQLHGYRLPQYLLKCDQGVPGGQQLELKAEELGNGLMTVKACQEQHIRSQRRRDRNRPVRLAVLRHGDRPL